MSKITGEQIVSVLSNSSENLTALEVAANKYLGVTDDGHFPSDIIDAFQTVGNAGQVARSDTVETFAAGFVAALKLVEDLNDAIE